MIRAFVIGISKKVFCIYFIVIVKLFCDTKVQIKATNSQNSDVLDLVSESRF